MPRGYFWIEEVSSTVELERLATGVLLKDQNRAFAHSNMTGLCQEIFCKTNP
jgi:hypothetical protein